jgi:hypothetical protein
MRAGPSQEETRRPLIGAADLAFQHLLSNPLEFIAAAA